MPDDDYDENAGDRPKKAKSVKSAPWGLIGVSVAACLIVLLAVFGLPRAWSAIQNYADKPNTAQDRRDKGAESIALLYSVDVPQDEMKEMPTRAFQHAYIDLIIDGKRVKDCVVTLVDTVPIRDSASCDGTVLPFK